MKKLTEIIKENKGVIAQALLGIARLATVNYFREHTPFWVDYYLTLSGAMDIGFSTAKSICSNIKALRDINYISPNKFSCAEIDYIHTIYCIITGKSIKNEKNKHLPSIK